MRFQRNVRRRRHNPNKRRHLLQRLEPRYLLAGDLKPHDLTDPQAERLLTGLDSFAEIAAAVRAESQLQTPLSFLETAEGSPQRLADVFQPE